MGTRNLTMVINKEGENKVAQYGQWDGYPEGVGVRVLNFLKNKELFEKFKNNLSKVRFLDEEGVDKDFVESYNKNTPEWRNEPDNRTKEQKRWWDLYCHRDLSEEVLVNIANSNEEEIVLIDKSNFAKDSLFCEWAYVIDLQKETFEIYEGFNKSPLNEDDRFKFLEAKMGEDKEYYPIRMVKLYNLSELPEFDDFVSELVEQEES